MRDMEAARTTDDSPLGAYLTVAEAAAALRRTPRSLSAWRLARQGPPFVKIGPTILYPKSGLTDWLESITVNPARRDRRSA